MPRLRLRPVSAEFQNFKRLQSIQALKLKMSDLNVLKSLECLGTRLKQTFDQPRVEPYNNAEILIFQEGEQDVHPFSRHIHYLFGRIIESPSN